MKKIIDVVLPYLVNKDPNAWYVEYRCYYDKTCRLERFRHYKGFNQLNSEAERLDHAKNLIDFYKQKILSGWRPWLSDKHLYRDEIQYHNVLKRLGDDRTDDSQLRRYTSAFLAKRKKELSAKSYASYLSKTRIFIEFLENSGKGNLLISEINQPIVSAFFAQLIDVEKLDKVTILKYRQNIGQMFKFFKQQKLTDIYPLEDLPKGRKTKDHAARPIADHDLLRYLNYVKINDSQLFLASLFEMLLCARPGKEIRLMKINQLDIYNKIAYISLGDGKTGNRSVTIPNMLVELIQQYKITSLPGELYIFGKGGGPGNIPVSENHFGNRFREIRKELNLPAHYKFYSFKHTGAGKLLESGATFPELMNHLGHTSIESTISYVKRHFGERSQKVLDFSPEVLKHFISN